MSPPGPHSSDVQLIGGDLCDVHGSTWRMTIRTGERSCSLVESGRL